MVLSILLLHLSVGVRAKINDHDFGSGNTLIRDVVVVGGGASGAYAAVRLREDFNKSVIVIEPKHRLGGHVDTYIVPETNTTLEYGVQSYMRYGPSVNFFQRFGVELGAFATRPLRNVNVDIETGAVLNYTAPTQAAFSEALRKWQTFVERYNSLVEPGYWDFPNPDKVPEEFLSPFGDFVSENNIEAVVPRIAVISGVGIGNLRNIPTLHVIQAFGAPVTAGAVNGFVQPVVSNSLLYQRIYALLKKDVHLDSTIAETERDSSGVKIIVQSNDGRSKTLIRAKQAIWTPYPSQENLKHFDQDKKEKHAFNSWVPEWNFVGVAEIPCIPENYSITYLPREVVPFNHIAFRDYPYSFSLGTTGPSGLNLFRVMLGANFSVTYEQAENMVIDNVQKLVDAGVVDNAGQCNVTVKALSSHNGVLWPRGSEIIREGFVQEIYSLQGHRSTWWTGRSWCGEYSSNVWTFTDTVLERLLSSIK